MEINPVELGEMARNEKTESLTTSVNRPARATWRWPTLPLRASSHRPHVSGPSNFDVSTFRLFDFSTFPPAAPTRARHKSCKRKKSRVSLYVTFHFAALTREPRACLHPRPVGPSIPRLLFFPPIVTFKNSPPCPIRTHAARRGQSDARLEATPGNRSTAHVRRFTSPPLARWVPMRAHRTNFRASSPRPQVLRISTFRFFDFSTFSPAIPTHARQKRWHDPREACVTLCHLQQ
ncbi:hypothetical protein B7486_23525 [cyanobacterium TDX16]|nr:hypothetical protein B7486_23525 [cyanobacterium TDX16]